MATKSLILSNQIRHSPSPPCSPYHQPMQTAQRGRIEGTQLVLLAVAVFAVSSAAILIRWADASALALSFWRTAGGALLLIVPARSHFRMPTWRQGAALLLAGSALAAHFWLWLRSLELTSVAASTTLVSTAPIFVALFSFALGRPITKRTAIAVGLALIGSAVIAGGDFGTTGSALRGDALAVAGAAAVAVYLLAGERLRDDFNTATYSAMTYSVAALVLFPACLATGTSLGGYTTGTWLAVGAMILGPQLLGHTVLNYLLEALGSLPVSLSLLLEPIGAGLLAWLLLSEAPTTAVWIGAPLIIGAVALSLRPS